MGRMGNWVDGRWDGGDSEDEQAADASTAGAGGEGPEKPESEHWDGTSRKRAADTARVKGPKFKARAGSARKRRKAQDIMYHRRLGATEGSAEPAVSTARAS